MQRNLLLPVKISQIFIWQRRNTRKMPSKEIQVPDIFYYKSLIRIHSVVDELNCSTFTGLYRCLSWEESVTSSHVATRLNGYVAGHGSMAAFNREWRQLGLSTRIAEYVRSVIIKRG